MAVVCSNCKRVLWPDHATYPPPDEVAGPLEKREPCPDCGSTARAHELTIGVATETDEAASIAVVKSPTAKAAQRELLTHGRHLQWTEPTEPGGPWLLEVFDAEGNLIDGGLGDDPEDALLEIAERLLPPE